jgi:hypothetical protein
MSVSLEQGRELFCGFIAKTISFPTRRGDNDAWNGFPEDAGEERRKNKMM